MLSLYRAAGLLTPILGLACAVVVVLVLRSTSPEARTNVLVLVALAMLFGAAMVALVGWFLVSRRLNSFSRAFESTLHSGTPAQLAVRGVPAERRLARAFNTAARAFARVEVKAKTDPLTGVANREVLLTALANEVERANRYSEPLSVAFIDIDRFKPINDTHGHSSGDIVLRQVADLVKNNIRGLDLLGRYGGEEFMLILPGTTPEDAYSLAEKLRALVMKTPLSLASGDHLRLTISVGIAGGVGGHLRPDRLTSDADAAMYSAKSLGRNQTYVFKSVDDNTVIPRAPVSAEGRRKAAAIGKWANATATDALASVLAWQPHHRGRPSDMIAALATRVAAQMALPEEEIERIRIASLLHDLGKLAIPHEILDKATELTEWEWQGIAEHPRIGQMILEQATTLRDAVPIVLHHHERYNGHGYPHGLKGREIPLGARVVAVADAYHAMVHDRPYQAAKTHAEALAELERHAGTQFDPEVVKVFVQLYRDGVPADGLAEVDRLHNDAHGGGMQPIRRLAPAGLEPPADLEPQQAAG
ncbi:MAG: diguanylate cyclase [Chloroflexota bacterium]|nr:diguanylate cyclase [Chloroflexota bacterium]